MTVDIRNLDAQQLDALRELANMGAGHAATALSELTGRTIGMDVPEVSVVAAADVQAVLGHADEPLTAVSMEVRGEISARIVQVFPAPTAARLMHLVLAEPELQPAGELHEHHLVTLQEIGSALVAAYLQAVSTLLGQPLDASPPDLHTGAAGGLLHEVLAPRDGAAEQVVCVNARLLVGTERLPAHVLLVPDRASLGVLFRILAW
jgi:chemotaxis protein CheC